MLPFSLLGLDRTFRTNLKSPSTSLCLLEDVFQSRKNLTRYYGIASDYAINSGVWRDRKYALYAIACHRPSDLRQQSGRSSRIGWPILFKVVPEETPRHKEKPHPCHPRALPSLNEPIVKHPKRADAGCGVKSNTNPSRQRVRFETQVKKHPQVKHVGGEDYPYPMCRSHFTQPPVLGEGL